MLEFTLIEGLSPDNPTEKKKRFDEQGGLIGRDPKAEWVLWDPERVVSSHHAKVIFSQGNYYLSDLSMNGISTASGQKLRKGEYRLLNLGDIYVIGSYRLEITALHTADATLPFQEAGLAHILHEPKSEEILSPLEYVQKQNQPVLDQLPFADFPYSPKPNTLKAFDFMPEPIDFNVKTKFIPQFCQWFKLDEKHFAGIEDEYFAKSLKALFRALAEPAHGSLSS